MTCENEDPTSIAEQAAHWWVVLHGTNASAADEREFMEWVARAPERVEACLRVARVHSAVSRADVRWPRTSAEELVRTALAAPGDSVVPLRPHLRPKREEEGRRPALRWVAGLAASIVVAVGLGWWLTLSRPEQFQTKLGEQRSVLLADGSRATLNTASKIEVRLQGGHRIVRLLQGEVLFEVAHDAQRPFDVRAGDVVVRAVGTRFDIDRRATHTTVTVVEGRVAMIAANPRAGDLPVLSAGDRVVVDSVGHGTLEHDVNLSEATSWTQHQLVFRHRPLGEVAGEFNRYNVGKIEIRSPSLRREEVTGTFSSNDVASFVAVLEGIPGAHVTGDDTGGYIVTSDGAEKAAQ
ncbi:MAG TPA: FecR domain-containing protein [Steroidobacteraceae bacterium]